MRTPSAPVVISSLALIIALGSGTAYAANTIAKNSVGTKELKNNAVTSAKVKDGSLEASDLSAGAVESLKGKQGVTGERGPQGVEGPQGPQGEAGANGQDGAMGVLVMQQGPRTWDGSQSNVTISNSAVELTPNGGSAIAWAPINGPISVAGKQYRLTGVEICLRTSTGAAAVDIAELSFTRANSTSSTIVSYPAYAASVNGCQPISYQAFTTGTEQTFSMSLYVAGANGSIIVTSMRSIWEPVSDGPT